MSNWQHVWQKPSPAMALAVNEVHVWRAALDETPAIVARLRQLLAADEIEKADRFHFERDRNHFIVARGLLRTLLGRYMQRAPEQVQFCYNAYGKPALHGALEGQQLHFNISHSHNLALLAFTHVGALGIDVEYMRTIVEIEQLAQHFFSQRENAMLREVSWQGKREAFFNCWTRKEAYIKARGEGLSIPLDQFDVSLKPGAPAQLLASREEPQAVARWSLQALAPGDGYAGALAVESYAYLLRCWLY